MAYSDDQLLFLRQLEQLAAMTGREADDEARWLIGDIRDEFELLKRGAVPEQLDKAGPLTAQDVLDFGAAVGQDFPDAQRGCEAFASVCFVETWAAAPFN